MEQKIVYFLLSNLGDHWIDIHNIFIFINNAKKYEIVYSMKSDVID